MDITYTLPESSTISVNDSKGETLFKEEIIFLERMLISSQEGMNAEDPATRETWLPDFRKALEAKHSITLTDTQAFHLAIHVCELSVELKKSLPE